MTRLMLRNRSTVLLILIVVVAASVHVMTYARPFDWHRGSQLREWPEGRIPSWRITGRKGVVQITYSRARPHPRQGMQINTYWSVLGCELTYRRGLALSYYLTFPLWFLSVPLAVAIALGLVRRQRRRLRMAGHCPKCGYSLRGNASGICPECGRLCGGIEPVQTDECT
jgi:hypothetical protein